MYIETLGKEGLGDFLSQTLLQNNKTVIFMCQSNFGILIMNEKSDGLLYANIPCIYLA